MIVPGSSTSIIQHAGDSLEICMFSDPAFRGWFPSYARVWATHVLPRRCGDHFVEPDWREFAQRNYTAIVRCWNTWSSYKVIHAILAETPTESRQIELHGAVASFFAMARAAIENQKMAFVDRNIAKDWELVDALEGSKGSEYPNIGWIRFTRNDLLHNRTLPFRIEGSSVQIDRSLLPVGQSRDSISWHDGTGDWIPLSELIENVWQKFPGQMEALWGQMFTLLIPVQPTVPYNFLTAAPLGAGSGNASAAYRTDAAKPPASGSMPTV